MLRLGGLQGAALPALHRDAGLLATLDYCLPRAWSRWVFEAHTTPGGIRYPSSAFPGGENTALFDRCRDALAKQDLGALATRRSEGVDLDFADTLETQG